MSSPVININKFFFRLWELQIKTSFEALPQSSEVHCVNIKSGEQESSLKKLL